MYYASTHVRTMSCLKVHAPYYNDIILLPFMLICSGFISIWIAKHQLWLHKAEPFTEEEADLPKRSREC